MKVVCVRVCGVFFWFLSEDRRQLLTQRTYKSPPWVPEEPYVQPVALWSVVERERNMVPEVGPGG